MNKIILIFFISVSLNLFSQVKPPDLKVGEHVPSFTLNTLSGFQSFSMPYINRIVMLHFWSTTMSVSRAYDKHLNRLTGRYKNAMYRSAEGFEVIAIAVQSDKGAWKRTIAEDSLNNFIHGLASKGYNDDVCKKFGITSVPQDILIDENGKVIAINPHISVLEEMLDDRKNFRPARSDVEGTLALSSDPSEFFKFGRLYLFDGFGDSIKKTTTNEKGAFLFSEVKLNQDFILKIDNKSNIITSDPLALYSYKGEKIMDGATSEKGFVFYIPSKISNMLTNTESGLVNKGMGDVDVVKSLTFKNNGTELTPKDEQDLNAIYQILHKNMSLSIDIVAHTDSKLEDLPAMDLTTKQSNTVKNYFVKKGISPARIKMVPKGKKQLRKDCAGACTEDDHKLNRRIEFVVYKS